MTDLLAQAFAKASELPEEEQDVIAALVLEEIESEQRWAKVFRGTEEALAKLAEEALGEHRAGKSKQLNPDEL